jgi:hypothetical protein
MDDELRRRARAARAEIEAQVDVEAELVGRPTTSSIAPITTLPPRGRIVAIVGSIAAVAVAIVGGVVLFRGPSSIQTSEPTVPIASVGATTTIAPSAASTTTGPGPATTSPGPTTTIDPASSDTASVSYLDPPPAATLAPLGVVPVPEPMEGGYQVAIGDLGVAVASWANSSTVGRVDVIGFDETIRNIDDLPTNGALAYGPGDVIYSSVQGESIEEFAVVAMPLSGDRVGQIIANEPASIMRYLEYPPSSFGHGAEGVAMRRDAGQIAIGYVDIDGNPTTLDPAPSSFEADGELLSETPRGNGVVTSSDGESWTLSIDTHPDPASTFVGPSPAAPTTGGDGVYWTHIGPDLAPEDVDGQPSQWVVAQLGSDGSARWWSLPEGWTIVASDIWGTVAVRQQGEQLEIALVEFGSNGPAPTTTLPAPPPTCRIDTDDISDVSVQTFIVDLITDRRAGEFVRAGVCLDAMPAEFTESAPHCWSSCEGWEQTLVDVPVNIFEAETPDACCVQRSFSLFVSYRQADQFVDVTEAWTLELADDGIEVRAVEFTEPFYTRQEAVDTLTTYLGHIRDRAWIDAALMLNDGAVNLEERTDLAQLDLDAYDIDSIADALAAWCADGCVTDVPTGADLTWDGLYGIGSAPQRVRVAWYEGTRSIYGLPIQLT